MAESPVERPGIQRVGVVVPADGEGAAALGLVLRVTRGRSARQGSAAPAAPSFRRVRRSSMLSIVSSGGMHALVRWESRAAAIVVATSPQVNSTRLLSNPGVPVPPRVLDLGPLEGWNSFAPQSSIHREFELLPSFGPNEAREDRAMRTRRLIGIMLVLGVLTGTAPAVRAADLPDQFDLTPSRLSYADGQVSFWRQGADDWAPAQVNTPLAPGDELYTASPANLEIQIGPRAFVRAWANTQLGLVNQEPDFLQFKVTAGSAAFDLRTIEPGTTVEVDTPNAALTIEHPGYYRVDVTGDRTSFITRRAGHATVTPASGEAVVITPSEEVVIEGTSSPQVTSYVAPQLDAWDKWNYARSDALLDAVSARYVSPGTYGVSDLDRYGTWRVVPDYGSVWVPTTVQPGWAPYTTGSWTLDPTYGWTWVDTAPWGWAPYHYGRWVSVDGSGPGRRGRWWRGRCMRPPSSLSSAGPVSVSASAIGGPVVGWVALGWGEPLVPWWGRPGVHSPAVVARLGRPARREQRGHQQHDRGERAEHQRLPEHQRAERRGGGQRESLRPRPHHGRRASPRWMSKNLQPIHTAPQVTATPASFVPTAGRGIRPPEASLKRSVVATRPSRAGPPASAAAVANRRRDRRGVPRRHRASSPRRLRREPDAVPARPPSGRARSSVAHPIGLSRPRLRSRPWLARRHRRRGASRRWPRRFRARRPRWLRP